MDYRAICCRGLTSGKRVTPEERHKKHAWPVIIFQMAGLGFLKGFMLLRKMGGGGGDAFQSTRPFNCV